MSPDSTALVILPAEAGNSLRDAARLEFQASLQLLADRACWVSAALESAVALEEEGGFQYCAVSGVSDHEPGTTAPIDVEPIRTCLAERWTVRGGAAAGPATFSMAVPVIRDEKAVGFVELTSNREFSEEGAEAVSRIADLITVTLEHREAADRAERLEFRQDELDLPSLWHAPENVEADSRSGKRVEAFEPSPATTQAAAPGVKTCAGCGFPVSPGRSLCVECEQKPEAAAAAAKNLFTAEPEESWLSAHGYTIASLLVTVLTAATILWLRR